MPLRREACSSYLPRSHLRKCHVPCPIPFEYRNGESRLAFAKQIQATLTPNDRQNSLNNIAATGGENGKVFALRHRETVLANEVAPYAATDNVLAASTDVGDVSWKLPVAQCFSPCFAVGTPLHTWQLVSQGRTYIAHKGMLLAAKTMAATTVNLFIDSGLLQECQQEHQQVTDTQPYHCPIPEKRDTVTFKITTTTQTQQPRNAHEYVIHTVVLPIREALWLGRNW